MRVRLDVRKMLRQGPSQYKTISLHFASRRHDYTVQPDFKYCADHQHLIFTCIEESTVSVRVAHLSIHVYVLKSFRFLTQFTLLHIPWQLGCGRRDLLGRRFGAQHQNLDTSYRELDMSQIGIRTYVDNTLLSRLVKCTVTQTLYS